MQTVTELKIMKNIKRTQTNQEEEEDGSVE